MTLILGPGIDESSERPALTEPQQACVDLLEETLREAREGNIHGIGIVVLLDGGFASVMAATRAGDLNLACDDLKRKILDNVTGKVSAPAKSRSNIIKVR